VTPEVAISAAGDAPVAVLADGAKTLARPAAGRRVFRNTLINGAGAILGMTINFTVIAFAIHRLGGAPYALWLLAGSFSVSAGYLSIFDLGLQQGIVKFVAEADGRSERGGMSAIVSSAVAMLALLAAIAVACLLMLSFLAPQFLHLTGDDRDIVRVLFLLLAVEAAASIPSLAFAGLLEGLQRYGLIRLIEIGRLLLSAAVAVVILVVSPGVIAFAAAMTSGSVIAAISYVLVARRVSSGLVLSPRLCALSALRPLVAFSAWIFAGRILSVAWRQMDKLILAIALTSALLTGYEVAARIQGAAAFALSFTASALIPATASLAAQGSVDRLRELLLRGTRYAAAVALPVTVGAMVLADPLIAGWVGSDYSDIATPTRLFLLYPLFVTLAAVANTMLVGMGRARSVTLYSAAATLINLAVSIALVHRYGVSGVITGTIVACAITTPLYVRLILKMLSISPWAFLRATLLPILPWAVLFAVVLATTAYVVSPHHLITTFAVTIPAVAVYTVGVGRFALKPEERRGLLRFMAFPR
jgi:O-antigen/teichoic acid export membrane protein